MEITEVVRGMEYDYHTDSNYTVPECPHCHEHLIVESSDIGKDAPCPCCGKMVSVPDAPWIRKYVEDNHGTRVADQKCIFCGKTFKMRQRKTNGRWYNAYGRCSCGVSIIV